MARGKSNRRDAVGTTEEIISTAVGAAEALTVGVVHLAERTLVEALHAAQDVGSEIGSTLVQATRGSIRAAGEIGGDLASVGRTVTRSVVEPARELGSGLIYESPMGCAAPRRAGRVTAECGSHLPKLARGVLAVAPSRDNIDQGPVTPSSLIRSRSVTQT